MARDKVAKAFFDQQRELDNAELAQIAATANFHNWYVRPADERLRLAVRMRRANINIFEIVAKTVGATTEAPLMTAEQVEQAAATSKVSEATSDSGKVE